MTELWKQYIWNPFLNYVYMVYFFGKGESWLEEEERSQHKGLPRR
jgi:hypothetical protein